MIRMRKKRIVKKRIVKNTCTLNTAGTGICGYIGFGFVTLMVQLSKLLMVMHHSCRMFGAQLEYMYYLGTCAC